MGFFYQAIKRATGQVEEPAAVLAPEANEAVAPAPVREGGRAKEVSSADAHMPGMVREHTLRHFELKHPISNLVAFLSPPVLESNVHAMEQCRVIRSRIREIMTNRGLSVLEITSALAEEGKTTISVNLAYALSQLDGTRVLLIDADLRRPSVSNFLGMNVERGLADYLQGKAEFEEVAWNVTPSLDVLPTKIMPADPAELLHSQRMLDLVAMARSRYRFVLIDGPPLYPIVDAQVLAQVVDAVLMVVRADKTPFDLGTQAADLVRNKLIGTVLNGVEHAKSSPYYGGYYGGYGYLQSGQGTKRKGKKSGR